ncbi:SGNH/GDSL hydrolase family protein [Burkholderia pyrrocinia]|uniref:SGNH/GDSL hydrolase family protein n=1 Tax=Burkholderia pyrrocinia TaxID=60550 RepID=UPI002AB31273|nr:SGNH/GDSL hydrolase family protein [Burkholderia pyrrocinia]
MFGLEYVDGTPQGTNGKYAGTPNNVPAELAKLLQEKIGPNVSAAGVSKSGATIRDAVLGQNGFASPLAQVLASDPNRIILENFGINDSVQYSTDEFRQYLIEFITIAQRAGKLVILETPQPTCDMATGKPWDNKNASVVIQVAGQMGLSVIDQYSYIQTLPDWCASYMGDGTHPKDDRLYAVKSAFEYSVVSQVIKLLL